MLMTEVIKELELTVLADTGDMNMPVTGGYV